MEAVLLERPQGIIAKYCKTLSAMSNNKSTDTILCTASSGDTSDSNGFHFNKFGKPI